MKRIADKTIRNIIVIALVFAVISVGVSSLYNTIARRMIFDEVLKMVEAESNNMSKTFDRIIDEADQISRYLLINQDVQNYILTGKTTFVMGDLKKNMQSKISAYRYVYDYIHAVGIYSEESGNKYFDGMNEIDLKKDTLWKQFYDNCSGRCVFAVNSKDIYPVIMTFIRKTTIQGKTGGIIINININNLSEVLGDSNTDYQKKYIISSEGRIVYKYNIRGLNEKIPEYIDYSGDSKSYIFNRDNSMYAVSVMASEKNPYKCIVENKIDTTRISHVRNITILIVVLLIMISLLGVFLINKVTQKPLLALVKLVDLSADERKKMSFDNRRVQYIAGKFIKEMAVNEELRREIDKQVKTMNELKKYVLGIQINPHFISSTLNLVHLKFIDIYGYDYEGNKLLLKCARCVQNIVRNNSEVVKLEEELVYTNLFADIIKNKSDNEVEVNIVIAEDVDMNVKIIKLCINTLLENAFYHGISPKSPPKGKIECKISKKDNLLICEVSDDGVGMSNDEVDTLRKLLKEDKIIKNISIGLVNIQSRIELIFGDGYGITIKSEENKGTTVIVTSPYII